jgi:hypothetical protein
MAEASKSLTQAEAGAKKQLKSIKASQESTRFTPGLEWEILQADAIIMLGLTQALSYVFLHAFRFLCIGIHNSQN